MKKTISLIMAVMLVLTAFCSVAAETQVTVYAPDGRTLIIAESELSAYLSVGWYPVPVQLLYAADGRCVVFEKSQVAAQCTVGWYTVPVQILYAEDGRSAVFEKSQVAAQCTVGWYTEPVQRLYAADGRSCVFPKSQVAAQCTVGWFTYPVANSGYKNAYANLLYGMANTEDYKNSIFSLVYIDNNDVPELVVGLGEYHAAGAEVYTFVNGQVVKVVTNTGNEIFGEFGHILYREREGLMASQYYGMGCEYLSISRLSDGYATFEIELVGDGSWPTNGTRYYVNDIEVTASEYFNAKVRYGFVGEFFNSSGYRNSGETEYELNNFNIKAVLGI